MEILLEINRYPFAGSLEEKISKEIETNKGRVHIESKLTLDRIQELIFASDFTNQGRYRSIYSRKEELESLVKKGERISLAILNNKIIIGFAVLDYPNSEERWARVGKNIIMELTAVEVLREHRNQGIAQHLLSSLFSDPALEQKIVYLTAYSWTWDLTFLGSSVQLYRDMLVSLYAGFKFLEYPTNEPNICLKPENIFMVRVGENVLQEIQEDFKWLRFGIYKKSLYTKG
ncbi:MAG: GNAT family N-acetyltransferase [Desulfobacula sp.]|nr:GNAT family N-acetyltransferase [Desulfobacula sp.]